MFTALFLVLAPQVTPPAPEPVLQDEEVVPESPTPADRLAALEQEYEDALQAARKAWRDAPEEERDEVRKTMTPRVADYVPRFLALAAAHPGTETAAGALFWIARQSPDERTSGEALELLISDHITSPKIKQVCWLLPGRFGDGERLLKRVLEKSPDRDTRGMACYGLANHLMTRAGYATQLQDPDQRAQYDEWLGEETSARLAEGNAVDLRKRSEMYFQRVVVEFGDVKGRGRTLGADAQRNLFELRNLQVGMVAPEIKGEDIDGTSFQISDYRGKVVVLDFWGNW